MQTDHASTPSPAVAHVFPAAPAYVKPVVHEGERAYAIHDQTGRPLAIAPSRDVAFAILGQQNIDGVDAH